MILLASLAHADEITVSAAVSLTEALQEVARQWTAAGHPSVVFAFDASSRLAKQIEAGAPADVFVSADEAWMDYLGERSLIDRATRADLVGNTLVAVVPAGSSLKIGSARDLLAPQVHHVALAADSVPAGAYARAALTHDGVWDALQPKIVSGDNVRTALAWVAGGEADAGFVYATDAKVEPRVKVAWTVPAGAHPRIVYPAAVVAGSAHAADAAAFLAWCRGPEAAKVFAAAGFARP